MANEHKPDPKILGPIDKKLDEVIPDFKRCEGVAYWRWAYTEGAILSDEWMDAIIKELKPAGYYYGNLLGKPTFAMFFYPAFE